MTVLALMHRLKNWEFVPFTHLDQHLRLPGAFTTSLYRGAGFRRLSEAGRHHNSINRRSD
jgi:hypothetical protein